MNWSLLVSVSFNRHKGFRIFCSAQTVITHSSAFFQKTYWHLFHHLFSPLCSLCPCEFITVYSFSFPGGSEVIVSACNTEDSGSTPGSGRSPGEGNGNPLQYSCLENPMARGAWWATVHGAQRVGHDWALLPCCCHSFALLLFSH